MLENRSAREFFFEDMQGMKDLKIEECSWSFVKEMFLMKHYLKSMPAGILACYQLRNENNFMEKWGGAVFSNGRIQYDGKFIEFSRLWITDRLGKNTESWFVSRCIKKLREKFGNYKGIVTWADPKQGHDGTLYLACNFVYDGESRKVKKFIGKNGKEIYQRTSNKVDIMIGEDEPKKRFIYYFDCKKREYLKNFNPRGAIKRHISE